MVFLTYYIYPDRILLPVYLQRWKRAGPSRRLLQYNPRFRLSTGIMQTAIKGTSCMRNYLQKELVLHVVNWRLKGQRTLYRPAPTPQLLPVRPISLPLLLRRPPPTIILRKPQRALPSMSHHQQRHPHPPRLLLFCHRRLQVLLQRSQHLQVPR